MREMCNENCDEWEECPLANILREGKKSAEHLRWITNWRSKVGSQSKELRRWLPLICAITGILIVESNLSFFPWKILGLMLAGGTAIYATIVLLRTDKKSCACSE